MTIKTLPPADAGKLSAIEQKHLLTLRALSARRHRVVLDIARNLLQRDMDAGTARIKAPKAVLAAEEARKAGKHLRLVVDNGPLSIQP